MLIERDYFLFEIVYGAECRFHILTWNVSTKFPENLPVHILLGLEKKAEKDTHRPDFFVIG